MADHKTRFEKLANLLAIPRSSMPKEKDLAAQFQTDWGETPALRRHLKQQFNTAVAAITAAFKNGAGLPLDQELRYFLGEYNNRLFRYGPHQLPSTFNVAEAFFEFIRDFTYFSLRQEADHLMAFSDFLDFATSSDAGDPIEAAMLLHPGVIYSYNNLEAVDDLTFSFDGGRQFSFAGVSMVRHGLEVSFLMIGGVEADLQTKTEHIRSTWAKAISRGERSRIPSQPIDEQRAEPLLGSDRFWKHDLLLRLDLRTKTEQARYVLEDNGGSFGVQTDDPDAFGDEDSHLLSAGVEAVERCAVLFDVAKTCLLLPEYFRFKIKLARDRKSPTGLAAGKGKLSARLDLEKAPANQRVFFRRVSSIEIENSLGVPTQRSFTPPSFKVEVDGFWRRLQPDQIGRDQTGQPVSGRTWVNAHLRWRDRPDRPKVVLVKASVRAARAKTSAAAINREQPRRSVAITEPEGEYSRGPSSGSSATSANAGYVYVMSSPALEKDIFKIGRTTTDPRQRAEELSKATGVPVQFLVVEDWCVIDCVRAEALIHTALQEYRLSDRREFFRAPFKVIRSAIEHVVTELLPESPAEHLI